MLLFVTRVLSTATLNESELSHPAARTRTRGWSGGRKGSEGGGRGQGGGGFSFGACLGHLAGRGGEGGGGA